jgi:lipopolysaccharide transport system permease protein
MKESSPPLAALAPALATESHTSEAANQSRIEPPYTRIRPDSGWLDLDLGEVWRFRELLLALATRDVKLRYRQTALGAIWVVLQPLMAAGVLTVVFGKVAQLNTGFTVIFAGLLGWNAFSNTFSKASSCIVGNSGLIAKVYFPRLILPLSVLFSVLLDFAVALVMLLVLTAFHGSLPGVGVLLLPVWLLLLMAMALGLGLFASSLMVAYRDVGYALPVLINLLFYASPVAYPLSEALHRVGKRWEYFFYLNPLTALIEAMRWSLLGVGELHPASLLYSAAFSVAMLLCGLLAFERQKRWFADVI